MELLPVLLKVAVLLNWSAVVLANAKYPDPALVIVTGPLKTLFPTHTSLLAPVFVKLSVLWKVVFLIVRVAEVILTLQFMVIGPLPKVVVVAPETVKVPFCTLPAVNVAVVPATVSVPLPRSRVPLVRVKFVIVVAALSVQILPPVTMVTLSAAPGIPLGVQFPAVFHAVDPDPFQV